MRLPEPVYADGLRKSTQVRFYGYDAMGTEGAICRMRNMTSDYWPELASRPKRYTAFTSAAPRGAVGGDALAWIDGTDLHYGETVLEGFLDDRDTVRDMVRFGDYLAIWPDRKYLDVVSGEHGSMNESVTVELQLGNMPGRYSSQANAINAMPGSPRLPDHFKAGDAVTISGCEKHPANNKTAIVREVVGECLYFLDDTWELDEVLEYTVGAEGLAAGEYSLKDNAGTFMWRTEDVLPALSEGDKLVIDPATVMETWRMKVTHDGATTEYSIAYGAFFEDSIVFSTSWAGYTETGAVTVSRTVPELDGVFAHENRLYGYKGDTVYASKWGDMFNWDIFDGTASDSWATETGTPGSFTGGISYGGYPRFFKPDRIFTLYGDYPSEYQIQELACHGVAEGSGRSVAAVSGRLCWLSPSGPCVYAGGEPVLIADAFGLERYRHGVGGAVGTKYYLSMQDEADAWHLFVYDTRRGIWMREDGTRALAFAPVSGELYLLAADGRMLLPGRPFSVPEGAEEETAVKWLCEFGDITAQSPQKKRITKLMLRLEMGERSTARVLMRFDSDSVWREAAHIMTDRKKSVMLPIVPRRTDHFRLRLEGTGGVRVSSLAIEAAAGSDR